MIGAGFGGLSGPAIKPLALRLVYEAAAAVKIPVIGLGGIASGEDAAEFLIAGARPCKLGTPTSGIRGHAPVSQRNWIDFYEEKRSRTCEGS
jgi:dihydroorotate dehydrogenase (NAD+) catalytic subunit